MQTLQSENLDDDIRQLRLERWWIDHRRHNIIDDRESNSFNWRDIVNDDSDNENRQYHRFVIQNFRSDESISKIHFVISIKNLESSYEAIRSEILNEFALFREVRAHKLDFFFS